MMELLFDAPMPKKCGSGRRATGTLISLACRLAPLQKSRVIAEGQ